jgi:hypothetical protein
MRTLLLLVPLAAVAYFVWQSTKSRIFLLGIPFLQFFRQSVFFESLRPFWIPGRLSTVAITMLWLVAVWAVSTGRLLPSRRRSGQERIPPFGPRPLPEELLLVLLAVVLTLSVLATAYRHADLSSAVGEASGVAFMLLGYLLVRGIVCHSERTEVLRFLQAIVVVNTVAAALFIVHQGLHIQIYSAGEYFQTVFQGQVITRTFVFMSPLLIFALALSFAKRRWTPWTYLIIGVNLVAVWVSYTRTMLAMAALVAAISILARLLKRGQEMLALRRAVAVAAVVLAVAVTLVAVLPTESNYFVTRIQHAMEGGGVTSQGSLALRNARLARTVEMVADDDIVLGRGFVTPAQDPQYRTMTEWSWDSAWIAIIYRMGLAGVVVFGALLVAYSARAFWLFLRPDPWAEEYGLLWFTFLVATSVGSFIGWGFMDQTRYPMNLWFLAFLAAGALLPQVAVERVPGADAPSPSAGAGRSVPPKTLPVASTSTSTGAAPHERGGPQIG